MRAHRQLFTHADRLGMLSLELLLQRAPLALERHELARQPRLLLLLRLDALLKLCVLGLVVRGRRFRLEAAPGGARTASRSQRHELAAS